MKTFLPITLFMALTQATAAETFAPAGAKSTLSVEYRLTAQGKTQDKYDLHEWRVVRSADVQAELVAGRPQPMAQLQPPEAGQVAKLQQQQVHAQKMATQMAPMMADAQAVVAKCGGDEKCIEREVMKMGAGMAGTQQVADTKRLGKEGEAVMAPGANRYQAWKGRTQKASYSVDEAWHVVHADPICMSLPKARCTHDMTRRGAGDLAAGPSSAMVEVDVQAGTMVLMLPKPLGAFAYVETHRTDEPSGTHGTPTPNGPQKGTTPLRLQAEGGPGPATVKIALKGGWASQAGEQTIPTGAGSWHGGAGGGGALVVRWRFTAQ